MMVLFNEIAEEDNNQSDDSQGDGENHKVLIKNIQFPWYIPGKTVQGCSTCLDLSV